MVKVMNLWGSNCPVPNSTMVIYWVCQIEKVSYLLCALLSSSAGWRLKPSHRFCSKELVHTEADSIARPKVNAVSILGRQRPAASCGHLLFTLTRLRIASQLCDLYLHLTKSQSLSSTTIFQAALSPFWSLNPKLRIVSRTPPNVMDDPRGVTVPDSSQGPNGYVSHHRQRRDLANVPERLPSVTRMNLLAWNRPGLLLQTPPGPAGGPAGGQPASLRPERGAPGLSAGVNRPVHGPPVPPGLGTEIHIC